MAPAHEEFSTIVRREDDVTILELHGELDATTAGRLDTCLEGALMAGARRVSLDLQHVAFIDSAGIGAIVGAFIRLRDLGGRLTVRSPSLPAEHALGIAGVLRLLSAQADIGEHPLPLAPIHGFQ